MAKGIMREMNLFRFQYQINDLENNRFEVLDHDEFFKELGEYLIQLYLLKHHEVALRVIEKIGECTCNINLLLRERALSLLLDFSKHVEKEAGEKYFKILSRFLVPYPREPVTLFSTVKRHRTEYPLGVLRLPEGCKKQEQ